MTKSDQNIHQNAPLKKIIGGGGACPRTPLAKRMAKFPNLKKKFLAPPLPNPGDATES